MSDVGCVGLLKDCVSGCFFCFVRVLSGCGYECVGWGDIRK